MDCFIREKKKKRKSAFFIVLILMAVLILLVTYINEKLDPLVVLLAEQQARNRVVSIINEASAAVLCEEPFAPLLSVCTGSDGKITSLSADSVRMTVLQTKITARILEGFSSLASFSVRVSFSNILDDEVFFGRFPDFTMPASIDPASSVETELQTEFLSAGINQTLHRVSIRICAHVCVLTLISNLTFDVNTTVTLAETLLVGDIPSVYLNQSHTSE